jgi:hypothetical protein
LLSQTHLCPHFIHTHSVTFPTSTQTFQHLPLKQLFFSAKEFQYCSLFLELEPSAPSPRIFSSFNHNFCWHKSNLFAASRAFTVVSLNNLIWRFQVCAFIKNMTAFFTNYLLRQGLSVHVDRNTIVAGYLYITTNLRNTLKMAFPPYMTPSYEPQTGC